MARKRVKPPYMLHKATGQARVKIDGKDYYLGAFGSPDSRDQYDALIAEWLAQQDPKASRLTIDELAILFVQHCDEYYRKPDGRPTGEATNMRGAIRPLLSLFGSIPCRSFSCRLLKQYREKLIKAGICRRSCNRNVIRVRGMFRWAVENEYIPAQVWHELLAVKGLAAGRSAAVETEAVKPVPQERVDAIEPHISRQLWACIQLQTLTGCRPGEVLQMRACDLNMSGSVWEFRPQSHKTQHYRKERVIMVGPQAQEIIRGFLKTDLQAYLFSPIDSRAEWVAKCKGPGRRRKTGTKRRQAGQRYSTTTYCIAIRRACEVAFGMPAELRRIEMALPAKDRDRLKKLAAEWRAEHCWNPHQLRHNAGTNIRREYGLDAARAILGHSSVMATEIYAELDQARAREVIRVVG